MLTKNKITLRTAILLPFLVIFIFTFSAIVLIQKSHYEEMIEDISSKQLSLMNASVNQRLDQFLSEPFNVALNISNNIEFNDIVQPEDLSKLQAYLFSSLFKTSKSIPQLDVLGFGSETQNFVGFRKEPNNGYSLMLKDNRTQQNLIIYRGNKISEEIRLTIPDYNPNIRPWYQPVSQSLKPQWSSIYTNADEKQKITLSALTPVFSKTQFIGVLAADIQIDSFNIFLQELQNLTNYEIYIFDENKRLVTHSDYDSILSNGESQTAKGERLLAIESNNPIIKSSAINFQNNVLKNVSSAERFSFIFNNNRYFSQVTPFQDEFGLSWYISISISESDLLGDVLQTQKNSWLIGLLISIIAVVTSLFFINLITKPITSTADAAKHLARGRWGSKMPQTGYIYETSMLVVAFNEMTNNLKASFDLLQSQLIFDSLTKLYSREGLIKQSNDIEQTTQGALLLIGLDRYREISDSLGHQKSENVLVMIAERLKKIAAPNMLIARTGGSEYSIYAPTLNHQDQIQQFADSILDIFTSPFLLEHESIVITASIGIVKTSPEKEMALWLRNSSIALSQAKKDKVKISFYRTEMTDISRHRTQMLARIQNGLKNDEFIPFYQPIINLETGSVVGAEALARWITHSNEIIPPNDFIPLAEESGLIEAIGKMILLKACRDTVSAIESGAWAQDFNIHVNASVNQLSQPCHVDSVEATLHETGLPAQNLTLEITESRIADSDPMVISNMHALKKLGISIAIDDFGTGYSSLAYLHKLPFDCLKIDRTFVNQLNSENIDSSIVSAIVNITKGFKVNLVAEGVETLQQAELLSQLHCPQAQGFLYSRPVPIEEWPTDLVNIK
ncbi:EAL domain-containing protein [Aliivibrio kagoshimensis]|uniref:bifunctional diguanylate cyclase/phosphodiesterase n=1 Tax=Aliivibrio kagoshimensis TaxID=2910230 RepID=UPI003D0BF845